MKEEQETGVVSHRLQLLSLEREASHYQQWWISTWGSWVLVYLCVAADRSLGDRSIQDWGDWEQRHSSEIWSFCCSSQVYTLGAPMCKELILDPCTTYRYPLHWVQTCIRWPHHVPSTPSPCYSLLEGPHTKLADFDSFLGVNVKRRKLSFFARCQAFHVLI